LGYFDKKTRREAVASLRVFHLKNGYLCKVILKKEHSFYFKNW